MSDKINKADNKARVLNYISLGTRHRSRVNCKNIAFQRNEMQGLLISRMILRCSEAMGNIDISKGKEIRSRIDFLFFLLEARSHYRD